MAVITYFPRYVKQGSEKTVRTDANGLAALNINSDGRDYLITVKHDGEEREISSYFYKQPQSKADTEGLILTDLALYKPGDTCRFSAIVYTTDYNNNQRILCKNKTVKILLYNASYKKIDETTLTTDANGRASGAFTLPKEGMLGNYSLQFDGDVDGRVSIRVEEYKQPSFYVEMYTPADIACGEELTLSGTVKTYSGMPVADSDVKITIMNLTYWWRSDTSEGNYTAEAKTDAQGRFEIKLATSRLKDTPFDNSDFLVGATVTNSAGESQESGKKRFHIGRKIFIHYDAGTLLSGDGPQVTLTFQVAGGKGDLQPLHYSVTSADGKVVTSGESSTPTVKIDSSLLPSGQYTVTAKAADAACTADITVYRLNDNVPPVKSVLWVPQKEFTVKSGEKTVDIPVGTSYPASYIFYSVNGPAGTVKQGFIRSDSDMKSLRVDAPHGEKERVWVTFSAVHDFSNSRATVTVIPAIAKEEVKVETLSFRDKISAGSPERWTFRYTFDGKRLADLPVTATLTDASLNALCPFYWTGLYTLGSSNPLNLEHRTNEQYSQFSMSSSYSRLSIPYPQTPDINTYGLSLFGGRYSRYGNNIVIRGVGSIAQPAPVVAYGAVSRESLSRSVNMADGMILEEKAANKVMAAPEMAEEAADLDYADESVEAKPSVQTEYRPVEMPVAWFKPNLSTDGDGVLDISFEVPDFNTTWQLMMFGYTPDLKTDVTIKKAVASKPVMASTNAPRFLRTGDKAVLMATLYNNTDKAARVSGRMELFNPLNDRVLLSREFTAESVDSMASRVIALEFDVPSDVEFIGFRTVATAGSHSDGEQSLIAILPSSSPVTESYPFYMAPDQAEYSLTLPKLDPAAQVNLQYCDNPIWECVTALPDMSYDSSASILSRANTLYGNAVAAGLIRRYPQLADAIRTWSQTNDSTLISPLQRNPELKIVALENTPWVLGAEAETLRMSRLTNLLDTANCRASIRKAIADLAEKQHSDGGWSWCDGFKSSQFITGQVLWRLAMLQGMGYLPEDKQITDMIKKGLNYCDAELYHDYIRAEKSFYTVGMLNYLYIRSFFPDVNMSSDFTGLKRLALKAIKKEWKEFDIYNKATAATLLFREKSPMEARTILESLRQFASVSDERGMWFDNLRASVFSPHNTLITTAQVLEAYAEITPGARAVDQLRQWLIIERQAQDWGQNEQLAEVVHAILTSGTDWTAATEPAVVRLNGHILETVYRSALTGAFTMPLTAAEASGATLTVTKSGSHQSWGGVLARYIAPIQDVKEFSESDVTIRKRLLIVEETADGTSVREPRPDEQIALGQKVRVQLTVTSARDIDYAVITDERGGFLNPVKQLSGCEWQDGVIYYREVRNTQTNLYLPRLPKGDFILEYDCFATQAGTYATGLATLQSLYAPTLSAHSAGLSTQVTSDK